MGLSDVAGVFSRFFIVGFFLPAFFALIALAQLATSALVPNGVERYSSATEILRARAPGRALRHDADGRR